MKRCYVRYLRNYSKLCKDLNGFYMIFLNNTAALTFTIKINCSRKTNPTNTQIFKWKFISINHSIIYYHYKIREFFAVQNPFRVQKLLGVLSDKVFLRFLSDDVLVKFLSDRVIFRGLILLLRHQSCFSGMLIFFYHNACFYFLK